MLSINHYFDEKYLKVGKINARNIIISQITPNKLDIDLAVVNSTRHRFSLNNNINCIAY